MISSAAEINENEQVQDMTDRIKFLVRKLNEAAKAYYQEDREILSNQEYDALYDELVKLEEETGVSISDDEANSFETVGDAVKYLMKELN